MTYTLFDRHGGFYSEQNSIFSKNYDDLFLVGARGTVISSRCALANLCVGDNFYDFCTVEEADFITSRLDSYERHLLLCVTKCGTALIMPSAFAGTRSFLVSLPILSENELYYCIKSGLFGIVLMSPAAEEKLSQASNFVAPDALEHVQEYCARILSAYGNINLEYLKNKTLYESVKFLSEKAFAICNYVGCLCSVSVSENVAHAVRRDKIDAYAALTYITAMAMLMRRISPQRSMSVIFDEGGEGITVCVRATTDRKSNTDARPFELEFIGSIAERMNVLFEYHTEKAAGKTLLCAAFCPARKDFSLLGLKAEPELL